MLGEQRRQHTAGVVLLTGVESEFAETQVATRRGPALADDVAVEVELDRRFFVGVAAALIAAFAPGPDGDVGLVAAVEADLEVEVLGVAAAQPAISTPAAIAMVRRENRPVVARLWI